MAYNDKFRLSCHAVILNDTGQVLLLKATYGDCCWGLPGGAIDVGETIHQTLVRECLEELGQTVTIDYLSGVYYHAHYQSQVFIFKAKLTQDNILLSHEHSQYGFFDIESLSSVQQRRIYDCLAYNGQVRSYHF
ncbi:NUDIX hydrolase [Shewanella marina]|uniref:NUDIX hydrolase n=1 Tax=Shewanella marina TaxID=487319 RepID=UPI0004714675|nr:NUDIX domain-containing protein [Shewanella marina]